MLRVWSEHLDVADLCQKDVLDLLDQGRLHPLVAVKPEADLDALGRWLRLVRERGLEPGIWPLLTDAQGYWPSERNAQAYFDRVVALLEDLKALEAPPAWVAVDLEPPLEQIHGLRREGAPPWQVLRTLRGNLDSQRFERSVQVCRQGLERVHRFGAKTLAVTLPMAAHDLRDGRPLWQDLFEAPWAPVSWDRAGIMAYGSMVAGYSRGLLSVEDARAIHYRLFRHLARHFGPRAHASLGVTGVGKLGDEPAYEDPAELAADAAAARAAGIHDLAIFCLDGLVGRANAGQWTQAVANAAPRKPPMTRRALGMRLGAATARHIAVAALIGSRTT